MANQVLIDRGHLDILLRRSSEYGALCQALLRAGITNEQFNSLLQRGGLRTSLPFSLANEALAAPFQPTISQQSFKVPQKVTARLVDGDHHSPPAISPPTSTYARKYSDDDLVEFSCSEPSEEGWQIIADKPFVGTNKRSFVLKSLVPGTTCKEIVDVLRGGKILDVYIAAKNSQAYVSFVDASVAKDFLRWTDTNPIRIRGQRISISYAEKNFYTSRSIEQRIKNGATRNLLLQGMDPDFDEQRIRQDLEHIHNLVVVEVHPPRTGDGIVISLNAIHLALYAKNCMRSRALYKKAQISFYPDKCADITIPAQQNGPSKAIPIRARHQPSRDSKKASNNPFDSLSSFDD